jgi:hypothetical protein
MYDIVNQCLEMQKQISVREDGEVIYMKPTHLLLTQEHYENIVRSIGVNAKNMSSPFAELYGLKLVFTEVPIEQPRVLSM